MAVTIGGPESGATVIMKDLNDADWMDGQDSYFYYKKILPQGTAAENLFTQVEIPELPEGYEDAVLKIFVTCEAVTTAKFDYREAWWGILNSSTQPPAFGPHSDVDDLLSLLAY
ncbi:MAG: hypothetical protein FWD16_05885 [Clostridia bacterium]|nr:hypothetical protein [Clostridia bacterium]